MTSVIAAMIVAYTAMAAPVDQAAPKGFMRVQSQPGSRIATKDNTINGTSIHNDAVAAPGPSTPFVITFNNSATLTGGNAGKSLYTYITGVDLSGASFFLQNDGTPYYPPNPAEGQTHVAISNPNINIELNPQGQLTNVNLPIYAVGARAYYSVGQMEFYANHGDSGTAIVTPSTTNPTDENIDTVYSWLEFSYHSDEEGGFYTNLSYVSRRRSTKRV